MQHGMDGLEGKFEQKPSCVFISLEGKCSCYAELLSYLFLKLPGSQQVSVVLCYLLAGCSQPHGPLGGGYGHASPYGQIEAIFRRSLRPLVDFRCQVRSARHRLNYLVRIFCDN